MLSRLSFFVATPALLFLTLAEADTATRAVRRPGRDGGQRGARRAAVRRAWPGGAGGCRPAELATGALASSYVNAGNLGIPVSVYVLGDASYVAPVLLFQVLVMAPVGLAVLAGSRAAAAARSWRQLLSQPLRTPVVIGCALGLLLAASGWSLPALVLEPVELIAALAVPAALLAYGMSLHGAPRPAAGALAGQVWLAVAAEERRPAGARLRARPLGRRPGRRSRCSRSRSPRRCPRRRTSSSTRGLRPRHAAGARRHPAQHRALRPGPRRHRRAARLRGEPMTAVKPGSSPTTRTGTSSS